MDLVSQVHHLLLKHEKELSQENRKSLAVYMSRLGFKDDALKIFPVLKVNIDKQLNGYSENNAV